MLSFFVLYQIVIRTIATRLGASCALSTNATSTVNPLQLQPRPYLNLRFCFHALRNCTSRNPHRSILLQMPRGGRSIGALNISTSKAENGLTPIESALTKNEWGRG